MLGLRTGAVRGDEGIAMKVVVDAKKIARAIERFAEETTGPCSQTSAVIGIIGGKVVRLSVSSPDEDEGDVGLKWQCVSMKGSK